MNNKQNFKRTQFNPQINVNSFMTKYYNNEQRTMNYEQFSNEPNSNLVCPELVEGFAQRTSSIKYPESRIEQIMQNEPNCRPITHSLIHSYTHTLIHPFTHSRNYVKRTQFAGRGDVIHLNCTIVN